MKNAPRTQKDRRLRVWPLDFTDYFLEAQKMDIEDEETARERERAELAALHGLGDLSQLNLGEEADAESTGNEKESSKSSTLSKRPSKDSPSDAFPEPQLKLKIQLRLLMSRITAIMPKQPQRNKLQPLADRCKVCRF